MSLIRFQNKVPYEYVETSRDFQLLCRLYDVVMNGVKYDIDGVSRVINTHECKSNILPLLQTKLGFFTSKNYTDVNLRTILECFPFLVKRKGSRVAIEEAVYMYLKIIDINTEVKVDIINDKPTSEQLKLYGYRVTDHSVVIGIESLQQDITLLRDVLRYIVPFGYNIYFYFFVNSSNYDHMTYESKAEIVLISNNINSSLMGSIPVVDKTYTRHEDSPARTEHQYSEYWQNTDATNIVFVDELPISPSEVEKTKIFILKSKRNIAWKWVADDEIGHFEVYPLYQYKDAITSSLVSTINMVEVGVHDKKTAESFDTYKFDNKSILNIETPLNKEDNADE